MWNIDFWPWGAMLSLCGWALLILLICTFVHNATKDSE